MKECFVYFFIFANFIIFSHFTKNTYSLLLRGGMLNDLETHNNYSNELVPGLNDVNKLKRIIEDLTIKLDEMSEKKDSGPHFKYLEVKMPKKGQEVKIKHNLKVEDIISVNVMIVNQTSQNMIMRSQVDLISQKVLYNWYVDKEYFVLIRPNNLDFNDNIFLEKAKLRITFTSK